MALNQEQIDLVRSTLSTRGWQEVMKPIMVNTGRLAMEALLVNPEKRTGEYQGVDDSDIRAEVKAYRRFLNFFENELAAEQANRLMDEARKKAEGASVGSPYGDANGGEPTE